MPGLLSPLLAVHLSDGVLTGPWLLAGFGGMALLMWFGAWHIRDEEIPRTALLTAAFFVASLIHVRLPPTSVHLLFNGLVGVVLGRRAALAIPVGVFLQAVLFQHGGYTAIGVNSCVITLPALFAGWLFAGLRRLPWVRRPWFRSALVAASLLLWSLTLVYAGTLLFSNRGRPVSDLSVREANMMTFHPATLAVALVLGAGAAWGERRLENDPEFPLGLLVGEAAVLATVFLSSLVLVLGGEEDWPTLILLTWVPHLVIAGVEGTVLGFTVGFVVRVKPELVGWQSRERVKCLTNSPR